MPAVPCWAEGLQTAAEPQCAPEPARSKRLLYVHAVYLTLLLQVDFIDRRPRDFNQKQPFIEYERTLRGEEWGSNLRPCFILGNMSAALQTKG